MEQKDNVLIVDDSRTMRLLLRQALETLNFIVHEAEDGSRALQLFPLVNPDIVLLDVEMPGMNGFDTCAALRKLPQGEHVPIVITTGLDDLNSINKAYEAKATDFLTKPINWDLLGHRVRYIIRTSRDYIELQKSKTALLEVQQELQQLNSQLEDRVMASTAQLRTSNQELSTTLESLKNAQEQLIKSEKMATFGNLVTGIANEVITPIQQCLKRSIAMMEALKHVVLAFGNNTLKRSDLATFLQNSEEQGTELVQDLQSAANLVTTFKQLTIDQATEERRKFYLNTQLKEILFGMESVLKERQVEVVVKCPEDIIVDGYPASLLHIITILVLNSLNHGFELGKQGVVEIDVSLEGEMVTLKYSDTGVGISKENMEKIFEPFYTTRRDAGFAGLGLHIAQNQIVKVLGGSIKCESTVGKGTTFIVQFPIAPS